MQLKHLFVFLLVFLVSIADATVYSQSNSSEYYQSSKVIHQKEFCAKKTKHIVFNKAFSNNYFITFFFPRILLKTAFKKQVFLTLKIQKQLYQKIANLNNQQVFLINKTIHSNSISKLYIA